ncbi:MAG: hypothetical protein R2729_33135 [Bryobacteraceae bacterium]
MVADLRVEHYEALKQRRKVRAGWLVVLHYIAIARALTITRILDHAVNSFLGIIRPGK